MKTILLFFFAAGAALAQIATPAGDTLSAALSLRGGQHFGTAVTLSEADEYSIAMRTGPRDNWDFGTTFRVQRWEKNSVNQQWAIDCGFTALYGSQGGKVAAMGGFLIGIPAGNLWIKGGTGNFRFVSAGWTGKRVSVSGVYGDYWENRGDVAVLVGKGFSLSAGWSSALGKNLGISKSFSLR